MALPERVAFDACALIHWADPASPFMVYMTEWIRLSVTVGQIEAGGSAALLVEARGGGILSPNPTAEARIRRTLLDPNFVLINLDRATGLLARELALEHGLKTWDAVHLASAVRFEADLLLTTDSKLLSVRSQAGVKITEPYPPEPHMFAG